MQPEALLEDLQRQEKELRAVLIELEGKFNQKKEQYLKVQGAIEGLTEMLNEEKINEEAKR